MSYIEKLQVLTYFGEFVIDNGLDVGLNSNRVNAINKFIENWSFSNELAKEFEHEELPKFAEDLEQAREYLNKIMEVE